MTWLLALLLTSTSSIKNTKHLPLASCTWSSTVLGETVKYDCSYDADTGTLKLNPGTINWFEQSNPDLGYPSGNYRINLEIDCKQTIDKFYTFNEDGFRAWSGADEIDNTKIKSLWSNIQPNGRLKFIIVQATVESVETNYTLFIDSTACNFGTNPDGITFAEPSEITQSDYLGTDDKSTFTIDAATRTVMFSSVSYFDKEIMNYPESGYRSAIKISTTRNNCDFSKAYYRRIVDSDGHAEEVKIAEPSDGEEPSIDYIQGYKNFDTESFGLFIVSWTGNPYDEEYIYFRTKSFDTTFRMYGAYRYPLNCDGETDSITEEAKLNVIEVDSNTYKVEVTGNLNYFTGACGLGMSNGWRVGLHLRLVHLPEDSKYFTINSGSKNEHTDFINPEPDSLFSDIDLMSSVSKVSTLKPIYVESPNRNFVILVDCSKAKLKDPTTDPSKITKRSIVKIEDDNNVFSPDAAVTGTDDDATKTITGKINFVSADEPKNMGFPHAGYRVCLKIAPGDGPNVISKDMYFYTQNEEGGRKHYYEDLDGSENDKHLILYQSAENKDKLRFLIISWSGQYIDEEYIYFDLSQITYESPNKRIMPAKLRDQTYSSVNSDDLEVVATEGTEGCTVTGNIKWVEDIAPANLFGYGCYRIALMFDIPFPITCFYTLNEEGYRKRDVTDADKVTFGETEGYSIGLILNVQKFGSVKHIRIEADGKNITYWIDASGADHETHDGTLADRSILSAPVKQETHGVTGEFDQPANDNRIKFKNVNAYSGVEQGFGYDGYQVAINFKIPDVSNYNDKAYFRAFENKDGHFKNGLIKDALDTDSPQSFDMIQSFSNINNFGIVVISWTGKSSDEEYYYLTIENVDEAFHIERAFRFPITDADGNKLEELNANDRVELSNVKDNWYKIAVSGNIKAFNDQYLGFQKGWRLGLKIRLYNPDSSTVFYTMNEGKWVERTYEYLEQPTDGSIDKYRDISLIQGLQHFSTIKQLRLKANNAMYHFIIDATGVSFDSSDTNVQTAITVPSTVTKIDLPESTTVTLVKDGDRNVYKVTGNIPLYPAGIPDNSFTASGNRIGVKVQMNQDGFTIANEMYFITIREDEPTRNTAMCR